MRYLSRMESISQFVLYGTGALFAAAALKTVYVKAVRSDILVDVSISPVLKQMRWPVHASHRGGSRAWPENTMLAFRNAVGMTGGVGEVPRTQVIEFDVQKSRDNILVIMHDYNVATTTNGTGLISQLTLDEIKKLDAGYRFTTDEGLTYPYRGKGITVPTLEEVLSTFVPIKELLFYIDFKSPGAVADTLEVVKRFGIEERIIMGAIPTDANLEVRRLKPSCVPVTPDKNSMILMYAMYCLGLLWVVPMRFEIVGTTAHRWGFKVLTPGLVKAFHDRGRLLAVFGPHIDTPEGQLDCIRMGVDMLFTDRPDVLSVTLEGLAKEKESTNKALS
ncbi:glycerophosphoryl diester phosphodiesterase [Klebsormidium nitens]|uniref:glycerophosphodiester phosphodiesterase n=1 Tax=Klebsormidium nitens TaxID=105231 RepID=A0A1Y1I3F3_KLENI|nr:glycerophosphoryl diester phosphodiesterase [Klebsormidium nitens]|eukprot:GAQ83939.1 glycerophosphoryl diester phosphodiesterase [Klebsormidium nitens]